MMCEREKNDGGHLQNYHKPKRRVECDKRGRNKAAVCLCFVSREEEKGRKKKRTNKQLVEEEENDGERLVI